MCVDRVSNSCSILSAWSPSSRRAQKLIFQALLQPVPPSPRSSSVFFAAAANCGVPRSVIWLLGMKAEQMRHVPVVRVGLGEILLPFLQLPAGADLEGQHLVQRGLQRRAEVGIDVEDLGGAEACCRTGRG